MINIYMNAFFHVRDVSSKDQGVLVLLPESEA